MQRSIGRRRQLAVTFLPVALAAAALAVAGWVRQPAAQAPAGGDGIAVAGLLATLALCLALGGLHRPLGDAALGIGAVALPSAIVLLGPVGAGWLGAGGYVLGGLGRRVLRRFSGAEPDERRGLGRLAEGAGRAALAALAAGLVWGGSFGAAGRAGAIWAGGAYLAVYGVAIVGAEALRRPAPPRRLLRLAVPLALDAAAWTVGVAVARVGAGQGWGLAALLLWAIALLALEAARLGVLQGAFERRAVDLERVSRASRRMAATGFGLAGLAAQVRAECLRVIELQWFQVELFGDGMELAGRGAPEEGAGRTRSWWAGPDGAIHGGTPDPGTSPPPLPGVHRRLPWRTLERELESGGRRLARIRLWADPRRVRPADVELLDSLLPQLASWVHRAYLDREAREDALTGIPTRRHLERVLADAFGRVVADGGRLAVVLADLDHFKAINDTHGHPAGDRALVAVATTIQAHRRATDTCARYGGEEFALVLDGADGETALEVAERLRAAVEDLVLEERGEAIPLTVSLGVAAFPELWASAPGELLALADEALYEAKNRGRNRALLNLGRGRYREPGGEEVGGEGRPVQAPRIFA